jgi:large subunit ribosomal protein L24
VKGDTVYVRSGRDVADLDKKHSPQGVRGRVIRILTDKDKVLVEGVNMVTKHQKPRGGGAAQVQQGGRIKMEAALPACRVMLVCPHCDKPTRIGIKLETDTRATLNGEKTVTVRKRVCKQCGQVMERPTDTRLVS